MSSYSLLTRTLLPHPIERYQIMLRRILLVLSLSALASLLVACNPGDLIATPTPVLKLYLPPTVPPEPTEPATEPPVATDTPAPPPTLAIDTTEVKIQLAQVEADTTKMRGLKPKSNVPEHFISTDEMGYNMMQQTLTKYTEEAAKRDVMRLWLLLFIDDPTMDFRQMEIEFGGQQVLGYYDPDTKELFVRSDQSTLSPASRETLAHEFTHSLQDQHHDLNKLLPEDIDHDKYMAIDAIVEGDATISGLLYASKNMSRDEFMRIFESDDIAPPVPGRAPVYLREGWQFPYSEGSEFVYSTLVDNNFNFSAIDRVFKDPPKSTEQVMHPEKYFTKHRDDPKPVDLPELAGTLGEGWTFIETDTLGEFDLQIMLRENFIEQPEASEGWGGAQYALYQNGDKALAIMGTRWDTSRDATEFETALENSFKLFEKRDGLWNDSRRAFALKHSGDQIMFVSGNERESVQRVMDSLKP